MSWGAKGLLLLAACVAATFVSPVVTYSCRSADGAVGCRVTRHAFGIVPYWSTRIEKVLDADSAYDPARRVGPRKGVALSETTIAIRGAGSAVPLEWTTWATIGASSGTIALAIDELVSGGRTVPLLAWQSNGCVVFAVFIVALPMAVAMLSRPFCERFVERSRWLGVIQRSYVVTLVAGSLLAAALFWGSAPEGLGLPPG